MIPTNSNKTSGCDPISSNCVIWQGPDLPCVDICAGDSISDVVSKLCLELVECCEAAGNTDFDITNIDQTSLSGGPATDLENLIQLIINNIGGSTTTPSSDFDCASVLKCDVIVPECLTAQTGASSPMSLNGYLTLLGTEHCGQVHALTMLEDGTVAGNTQRIGVLESNVYSTPTIYTSAIGTPSVLQPIDTVLQQLETDYIRLRNATGLPSSLYSGIGAQGSMTPLVTTGWVGEYHESPATVADTLDNIWSVIKDLRTKVLEVEGSITAATTTVYPLMGGSSNSFASGVVCHDACSNTGGECVNIYNESGSVFDTTVRAYSDAAATTELSHDTWYVICGTKTVAKYSTITPYWRDITDDCETNCTAEEAVR